VGDVEAGQPPDDAVPARTIWASAKDALYEGPMDHFGPDDPVRCARCREAFSIGDALVIPSAPADPRSWFCITPGCAGELQEFIPLG
jgi:hypothetical protein